MCVSLVRGPALPKEGGYRGQRAVSQVDNSREKCSLVNLGVEVNF